MSASVGLHPLDQKSYATGFWLILVSLIFSASPVHAIQSDDFSSAVLDTTLWALVDPVGDATLVMTGTNVVIDIPGGTSHDLWSTCNCAPRVLQPAANTDFEIEVKFDSEVELRYQMRGLVVGQDLDTYLRFDVFHDGTQPYVFAAFVDGAASATTHVYNALGAAPAYVRVGRTGDTWTYTYSYDGSVWQTGGTFVRAMTVTEVGFFIGSHDTPDIRTPPHVGNVDYFFNTTSPIVPEDGGTATAPSPPVIEVWYGDSQDFGHLGTPQTLIGVVGRVWDTEDVDSLSFRLNGGASRALSMGPDGFRLVRRGEYNIEVENVELSPGANTIAIRAVDALGEESERVVTVNYTPGVTWGLPATVDWTGATKISDAGEVVDGLWRLTGDGVRTDSSAIGYDRLLVVGDHTWETNYEVVMPMTVHATTDGQCGVGMALGWQGYTGTTQPKMGHPYQSLGWITDLVTSPKVQMLRNGGLLEAEVPKAFSIGTRYLMKMRSEEVGGSLSHVSLKVWEDGTPEPGSWDLESDFTTIDGSVLLIAHQVDVTFGNITITPTSRWVLTTNVVGSGAVAREPNQATYADSATVILTAVADPGWSFAGWSDGLTGSENPDTLVITSDTLVTATFVDDPNSAVVTVNIVGQGQVMRQPDQPSYAIGDTLILTAVPDSGWSFTAWSGDLTGSENPDTLIVTGDLEVTATFNTIPSGIGDVPRIEALSVLPNVPNPFGSQTLMRFALPAAAEVRIEVFDVRGQRVWGRSVTGVQGWNRFVFDGRSERGNLLPSGVYFCRFAAGRNVATHRFVIAR